MKKKLEAELISIAHRILKLKNRSELDQLQQETLKLYEKISVLRFVEDNFSDVKPTIGHASAEETLEEIYGIAETPAPQGEVQQDTAPKAEEKQSQPEQDKENGHGEGAPTTNNEEMPVSEEEKRYTEEETDEKLPEGEEEDEEAEAPVTEPETGEHDEDTIQEEEESQAIGEEENDRGEGAPNGPDTEDVPVSPEEIRYTEEETDEELPSKDEAKEEPKQQGLAFDFETPAKAPEKPKEIGFEDFHDYKEPEFVKKSDIDAPKPADTPKPEETSQPAYRDWRDWEPSSSPAAEKKEEPVKEPEQPKQEESRVHGTYATRTDGEAKPKSLNEALGKSITLGLNDRIAFEKNLFGGSGEDLNRVLSQLNTMNSLQEARNFIEDLVKPDYNNWQGKEEYEERFMALVEKKFD